MSGHAPGPWTITHWGINSAARAIVFDSTMYPEDARLIVAAPIMLAALQGMLMEWERLSRQGSPMAKAANERVNAARAAIAEATEGA